MHSLLNPTKTSLKSLQRFLRSLISSPFTLSIVIELQNQTSTRECLGRTITRPYIPRPFTKRPHRLQPMLPRNLRFQPVHFVSRRRENLQDLRIGSLFILPGFNGYPCRRYELILVRVDAEAVQCWLLVAFWGWVVDARSYPDLRKSTW